MTGQDHAVDATEHEGPSATDWPEHSADIRLGRELLQATRPFANESIGTSWRYVITIFVLMIAALAGVGLADGWPLRTALSVLGALFMMRTFITNHDYMRGAILRDSCLATMLVHVYGWFALVPAKSWSKRHNDFFLRHHVAAVFVRAEQALGLGIGAHRSRWIASELVDTRRIR